MQSMLGWTRREGWTILKQGRGYPGVTPGWPVARTGSGLFIPPGLSPGPYLCPTYYLDIMSQLVNLVESEPLAIEVQAMGFRLS